MSFQPATGLATMTEVEAVSRLRECQANSDPEAAHADADHIVCQFLYELGFYAVVEEWEKVAK